MLATLKNLVFVFFQSYYTPYYYSKTELISVLAACWLPSVAPRAVGSHSSCPWTTNVQLLQCVDS